MRIALVGLQTEHTPPAGYGATGRIVAGLAAALRPHVEVVAVVAEGSRLSPRGIVVPFVGRRGTPDPGRLARYRQILSGCDVVHNHDPAMVGWLEEHVAAPVVTTLHTNLLPAAPATRAAARFAYLSTYQARSLGWAGFAGWGRPIVTAPQAPPAPAAEPARSPDLLMLGQVRPEKGIVEGCQLAAMTGRQLVLAGPLARRYQGWFAQEVMGRFGGRVVHLGEVADPPRLRLLRTSAALLFLSRPAEPLGLVMLEAMSVGTPVLALDCGACRELVTDGQSGFIRGDLASLAAAVDQLSGLSPDLVRRSVQRFSPKIIVEEHLRLYRRIARTTPAAAGDGR